MTNTQGNNPIQKKYQIIYADPPWRFEGNMGKVGNSKLSGFGADLRYPTMTEEELQALAVNELADKDCALFMWTTGRHLPIAINLIKYYGFEYRTIAFIWIKTSRKTGLPNQRLGYWTLSNAEICLLGIKGHPRKINNRIKSVYLLPREGHSKKPELFRNQIDALFGDIPRIELFARQKTEGWDVWGNEVESDVDLAPSK